MPDEPLIFAMGKFDAHLPTDRNYVKSHLWLQAAGGSLRVGFTAYAVRLLQDVYFLEWSIDPLTDVREKQEIGQIESSKAVSTMYPPTAGRIVQFNPALYDDPSLINADPYERGWLYEFETTQPVLSPQEYFAHLEATWETTQRILKSQYNE